MNMVCVNLNSPELKKKAKDLDISMSALESAVHRYRIETGNPTGFPSDSYIKKLYSVIPTVVDDDYADYLYIWEEHYNRDIVVDTLEEATLIESRATSIFNKNSVVIKPLNNGKFKVLVAKPMEKKQTMQERETALKKKLERIRPINEDLGYNIRLLENSGIDSYNVQLIANYMVTNADNITDKDTFYDIYVKAKSQIRDGLRRKYNNAFLKEVDNRLEEKLRRFLGKYGYTIKEGDISELFEGGVLGAIDIINKVIYLSKNGRNKITFPEEFAHAFVELMGAVESNRRKRSDFTLYDKLSSDVVNTTIYKQVFEQYKDVYTLPNGNPDYVKIRKEAVGQALATAIVTEWESIDTENDSEENKGFLGLLKRIFNRILNIFARHNKEYIDFEKEIQNIARSVLRGETKYLDHQDRANWNRVELDRTIEAQDKRDGGIATSALQYLTDTGHIVTGSISYRLQGVVRRKEQDSIHDIDSIVPKSVHNVDTRVIRKELDPQKRLNLFYESEYAKKLRQQFPGIIFFTTYDSGGEIVVGAVYSPKDKNLAYDFSKLRGSYEERLKCFNKKQRQKIYLFDFFLKDDDADINDSFIDENSGIRLARWETSFEKKLLFGRKKDVMDYQEWIPNVEFDDRDTLSGNIMYQRQPIVYNKEQEEAIEAVVKHITDVRAGKASQQFFSVIGKAGTGKTTIVSEILRRLPKQRYSRPRVIVGALSHKATTVLFDKVKDLSSEGFDIQGRTIASMLNMREDMDGGFSPIKGEKPITNASIVFIDESSMVNEEALSYIVETLKGKRIPVIFLGDSGQLPPIRNSRYYRSKKNKVANDALSPVLTDESIPKARLITRVRQGEESPVLEYADGYWEYSHDMRDNYPVDVNEKSVVTDEGALIIQNQDVDLVEQLIPLFEQAKREKNPNLVKIVAYTTNDDNRESAVSRYNRLIRKALYPDAPEGSFEEGDLIIFNDTYGRDEKNIPNSTEGSIVEVTPLNSDVSAYDKGLGLEKVERILVTFQDMKGRRFQVPALKPTPENIAKHKRNIERLREYRNQVWETDKGNYYVAKELYESYKQIYAASIGYAYAISSHKSQGSTYEVVAVDAVNINGVKKTTLKSKARGIYTALTRASNVTIVSSNTTNESTIYVDVKGINDRINAVKAGTAEGEFVPETEEGYSEGLTEEEARKKVYDPDAKNKKKKTNVKEDKTEVLSYDERENAELDYDEEGEESFDDIDDESDPESDDEDENLEELDEEDNEDEDLEELNTPQPIRGNRPKKKVNAQTAAYNNFVLKQRELNSVITLNREAGHHDYTVNGRNADYSITEFRDLLLFGDVKDVDNAYTKIASPLGNTYDEIMRDFFAGEVKASYPNVTKEQLRSVTIQAAKLKAAIEKSLNPSGNGELMYITDEDLLKVSMNVKYNGQDYLVAGTMDMVVIDQEGKIHIIDFKTKRANRGATLDEETKEKYSLQVSLYRAALESNPTYDLGNTYIAQFNILYADPTRYEYKIDKNGQVWVKVNKEFIKVQEAAAHQDISGKPMYKQAVWKMLTAFTTDVSDYDLRITPIKTTTQQASEGRKVHESTRTTPRKFEGRMIKFYGKHKRSGIKAVSTFGAILEGKRTATTRYDHIEYWKKVKIGDIITFKDANGKTLQVRVTVPLHKLSLDTDAEEWSKKEGWSVEHFRKEVLPKIKKGEAYQMEFELVKKEKAKKRIIEINSKIKQYEQLSNFGDKPFEIECPDGRTRTFKTVEHYYHYRKAILAKDYEMAGAILKAKTPKAAKYFGRHRLSMTDKQIKAWNKIKKEVMLEGMRAAFEQNDDAVALLLSTGEAMLTHFGKSEDEFADNLMILREEFGGVGKPITKEEAEKQAKRIVRESSKAPVNKQRKGVKKIISGAQTGVDTIGLEVGKELNIETGGTAAPGFLREKNIDDYTREDLEEFGVEEIDEETQGGKTGKEIYLPRTEKNVEDSDGTVYFATDKDSAGKKATERFAIKHGKPFLLNPTAEELRQWIKEHNIETLNVAGNRGSKLEDAEAIKQILREAISENEETEWVENKGNKIQISKEGYRKGQPQDNPDVAYVFTENAQAAHAVGYLEDYEDEFDDFDPKLNVSDRSGSNQAGIRTDEEGNITPNAFGIVVKKRQQDAEGKWLKKEGQFEDTDEDYQMFIQANNEMFESLERSGLKKIVFPSQMALGKAALPERFATWLSNELFERFGIKTKVDKNTTEGYEGYGLILESVVNEKLQRSLNVDKISSRYSRKTKSDVEEFMLAAQELRRQGWHVEFYAKTSRDGTMVNEVMTISIDGNPEKGFFELVKDVEDNSYSVHFKTKSKKALNESEFATEALEDEEKENLFKALIYAIPDNGLVSTWGSLSPGGIAALNSLSKRSGGTLVEVGRRTLEDKESNEVSVPIYRKLSKDEFITNFVNRSMSRQETVEVDDSTIEEGGDYYKCLRLPGTENVKNCFEIRLGEVKSGENQKIAEELSKIMRSLPYSSLITLNLDRIDADFLYTIGNLMGMKTVYPVWGETVITLNPQSNEGIIAEQLQSQGKLKYDKETGKLYVPQFTRGYKFGEILARASRNRLLNSTLFNPSELRELSKATIYKLSEIITHINEYANGYARYFDTKDSDPDFTKMTRIEVIKTIGLKNLLNVVKDRVFDTKKFDDDVKESTYDKADLIYENWDAFVDLAYDTLISVEEISLDDRQNANTEIRTDLADVEENTADVIQELFGDSIEHWQVGFRQVSVVASLSALVKSALNTLYIYDNDGKPILNEFGIGQHLDVQEAVSKILYFTQGARSLDDMDSKGYKQDSMLYMLKKRLPENPWLQQIIDLLEDQYDEDGNLISKANEQFKSQFYSNFKKYFQQYAIVFKDKNKKVHMKVINKNAHSDILLVACQAKENGFAFGTFNLKTKEGVIDTKQLQKLQDLTKKINKLEEEIRNSGDIKELVDLSQYHKAILDVFELLNIDTPAKETVYSIFGVKKNFYTLSTKLHYLLKSISELKENGSITSLKEYKDIIELISKESGLEMESVSYEAGKLYYSYVLPSYLGRFTDDITAKNMTDEEYEEYLQREYLQYPWFYKNNKIRCRWLKRLKSSSNARQNFEHVTSLHYMGTEYSSKSPVEYIASMMQMYFFDDNKKWAYYRVPIMSNKPAEDYIKFDRISRDKYPKFQEVIINYLWDVFMMEVDRIQAVAQRKERCTDDQKISSFDTNGSRFVILDYLQDYYSDEYKNTPQYKSADAAEKKQADDFHALLNKMIQGKIRENSQDYKNLMSLYSTISRRELDKHFEIQKEQWKQEGFTTYDDEGKLKKTFGKLKLEEADLEEFFYNDLFASTQIMLLTITDPAYYKDAEDLQKRLAQIHAPGMMGNINALDMYGNRYVNREGLSRTIYIKDDKIKSSVLENLEKAKEQMLETVPPEERVALKRRLDSLISEFKKINFADAQGYSCPSSYRKKMGIFGNWDQRMEDAYLKLTDREHHSDIDINQIMDVLWQPLKPFVYTQIPKNGYNDVLPTLKVGMQNKNSEYVLIMADALLRRAGLPNTLSVIYDFMEESQHDDNGNLNGEGIDTIQFESAVKVGLCGVIDLNGKSEEEVRQALGKAYSRIEGGQITYNQDYVHEIPFKDYMIQQNVPSHFREHSQQQGSQNRVLIFADMLDYDPVTGKENTLLIDGVEVTVKKAKENYFKAIADNIEESKRRLIKELKLDNADRRETNIAISELLKREIRKDSRFGPELLWACDTNELGEFNIPLSDPIHSNRIQQLLNSIIKNKINKQEIAGGPVVQTTSWGFSDPLYIRFKTENQELLVSKEEFELKQMPKGYDKVENGKRVWKSIDGFSSYEEYIADQAGVAYYEAYAPIQDKSLLEDFLVKDAEGNEYIDVEKIEETNPDLLWMVGYRIPTESKYSMVPIKIKGFIPINSGESIMLPAEITTQSGSDFDIDKMYIMRYAYTRLKSGEYVKSTEGRDGRNNLILSTQLAVLQSKQVQQQLFTPGNFETPKKFGYLISYVQSEHERTGKSVDDLYKEGYQLSNDELKAKNKSNKNLIFNYTQVQFHKQNMAAGKLIGIFAQANVSHAFISMAPEEQRHLLIPDTLSFTLNGIYTGMLEGQGFPIDSTKEIVRRYVDGEGNVVTETGGEFISNNLASFLAASVDAVKDPILNLININQATANFVTSMIRMGFSIKTVALLCGQPILKDLIKEYNIEKANNGGYADIRSLITDYINELPADVSEITDIQTDDEALISNLDGSMAETNYMVLKIFERMLDVSDAFGDITHMTRYNSINSAVGPYASDTMLNRIKDIAFEENALISAGLKQACGNPILMGTLDNPSGFRDASNEVEQRLLGQYLIQASSTFFGALQKLSKDTGHTRGVSSKIAIAFTDFYMSFYANASQDGSVFDLSMENRRRMLVDFPKMFLHLKEKYKGNVLIDSIQYRETNREQFGFLEIRTRGLSSEVTEDLTKGWLSLYKDPETRGLAIRIAEYNFFRGSFGFNPKTFLRLIPNNIKRELPHYTTALTNRGNNIVEMTDFNVERVIYQFILHNPKLITDKYQNLSDFDPEPISDYVHGECIQVSKKGKKSKETLESRTPFIKIDDDYYFIVKKSEDSLILRKVDILGGDHQGFEMSLDELFPTSIFEQNYQGTKQTENSEDSPSPDSKTPSQQDIAILINRFFTEDELIELVEGAPRDLLRALNIKLQEAGEETINERSSIKKIMAIVRVLKQLSPSDWSNTLKGTSETLEENNYCS